MNEGFENRWLSESKACQTERKSSSKTSRYNKQASESAGMSQGEKEVRLESQAGTILYMTSQEQFAIIRTVIKSHTGCLWAVRQICYKIQCPPPPLYYFGQDLEYAMSLISFFLRDSQSQEYITHSETFTVKCPFIHVKLICHGIPLCITHLLTLRLLKQGDSEIKYHQSASFPLHLWLCA